MVALGVVLVSAVALDVVLVIHLLRILLGVLMSLDLVDLVHALGLSESVDLGADNAGKGLLGEGVADGLAYQMRRELSEGPASHVAFERRNDL